MVENFPRNDAVIDFSFLGQASAGVRRRILEQFGDGQHTYNAIVRDSGRAVWAWSDADRAGAAAMNAKQEYADLLRRSKFVLCPRGFGTSSFRLFETMQAGRVPVIISDAYVKPAGIDWDSCSLTIPESRLDDIPAIIQSRLGDWDVLAANARTVWESNFAPQHVMDFFAKNLTRMSAAIAQESFSPIGHSARVGATMLEVNLRPIAGRVKQAIKRGWSRK
jgi:hypothetical protein